VKELTAHLGWDQFHVIGVSGGGPYVLACAHAMPEHLLGAGVVCGAPPLRVVGTEHLMWTYRLALWGQRRAPVLLAPGLSVAERLMRLPPDSPLIRMYNRGLCERDRLAINDRDLYRILTASGRVAVRSGARELAADGTIYSSEWGMDLGGIRFPIHYWHGGCDKNIPPGIVQKFLQRLPNASLTVMAEDGHYSLPMLCNEEIVAELHGWK
jgi:pimeloyl-ACP methyl ester carboxylesterase